jgi:hypothetical protein
MRKIVITDNAPTRTFRKLRGTQAQGRSVQCLAGHCLYQAVSAPSKVTKTKAVLKQETYNLGDLKHDPHFGVVAFGDSEARPRPPSHSSTIGPRSPYYHRISVAL